MMTDLSTYPIRYDIPAPVRKRIDRATRMGPKPSKLRRSMEAMRPGGSIDIPLADFPKVHRVATLLANIATRAGHVWGAGCFTTQGHEDFVRVWRLA